MLGVHAGVKFRFFPDRHDDPGVFFRHYSYESTVEVQCVQVMVQEVFHNFLTFKYAMPSVGVTVGAEGFA